MGDLTPRWLKLHLEACILTVITLQIIGQTPQHNLCKRLVPLQDTSIRGECTMVYRQECETAGIQTSAIIWLTCHSWLHEVSWHCQPWARKPPDYCFLSSLSWWINAPPWRATLERSTECGKGTECTLGRDFNVSHQDGLGSTITLCQLTSEGPTWRINVLGNLTNLPVADVSIKTSTDRSDHTESLWR